MFCANCGNNLPERSIFCSNCGFKIESESDVPPVPSPEHISDTDYSEVSSQPLYTYSATPESNSIYDYGADITYKKKKSKTKIFIASILLIAIIGMSVFSYLTLSGFEGEWKIDGSTYKTEETWMEKGTGMTFESDELIITDKSGKTEKTKYSFKDNKVHFNFKNTDNSWNVDCGFLKMKFFKESDSDSEKMDAIYFKRIITTEFFWYAGIIFALIIAFIITIFTGKKSSKNSACTIGATYNVTVNPLSEIPSASQPVNDSPTSVVTNIDSEDTSEMHTQDYKADWLQDNTDPLKTRYAPKKDKSDSASAQSYTKSSGFETAYAPSTTSDATVEIVFSPEEIMDNFTADEYSFVPGSKTVAPVTEDEPVEPVREVIPVEPVREAPDTHKVQKPSTNPSFKSAGDL